MTPEHNRILRQAAEDYIGTPVRWAVGTDRYGETHIVVECRDTDGYVHYLDWIGGTLADSPDEFGDELPLPGLRWLPITPEQLAHACAGEAP